MDKRKRSPCIELEEYFDKLLHSVHCGINPLFLTKPPLKSANCPSPPFLSNPSYVSVFREPPKNLWTPKILQFFILHPILSFKSNELVKTSQFEFLVMTEQNLLVYKLFFALNIPNLSFFMSKFQPPWKRSPLLPQQPLLKIGPVNPTLSFWKFGMFNLPPPLSLSQQNGGCTPCITDHVLNQLGLNLFQPISMETVLKNWNENYW